MKTICKLLCVLLALVCCLGVFAGCKDDKTTPTDTGEAETKPPQDENADPFTSDDLAASYNFGNKEYVVLSRNETAYEFTNEAGQGGTPVEKAVYQRNEYVMERCNVVITVDKTTKGDWWNRDQFITRIRNNAQEGSSDYSLINTHSAYLASLGLEGVGYNLTQLPNINLEKRWWSEKYYDAANYNGAVYTMLGDISYTLYEYMMVIFYNEQMAEDLDITGLYETALDGDWNFELMKIYTKYVTTDLDRKDETDYGFLGNGHGYHAYVCAFGLEMMPVVNDVHTMSLDITDDIFTPISALIDFAKNTQSVRNDFELENSIGVQNPIFSSGRALFYEQKLGQAMYFKEDMEDEYGVLPYPKFNDNQVEYHTDYCDDLSAVMVPRNIKEVEMVGTVTEMLCMESYNTVVEQFYEVNLKYRAFNDPQCVETLELIRTSLTPAFAKIYSASMGTPLSIVGNIIENNWELASYWAQKAPEWRTGIDTVYAALEKLEAENSENQK